MMIICFCPKLVRYRMIPEDEEFDIGSFADIDNMYMTINQML